MPFYEYQCTECGKVTEVLQKISDPPLSNCSSCSGKMKKLISQSTFHLKGSGWYVTDYSNNSGGCNAKATGTSSESTQNDKKENTVNSKKVPETPKKEVPSSLKKEKADK